MADLVDDIKARLGIEELVSQYVQLKKAGQNLKGLCPFHSEKTPSFVVSPEKQICHCFGCNKGGDIFAFIEQLEGVTFTEALQILGEKVGIKVDRARIEKKTQKSDKDLYFKAHELACEFFEKELYKTNDGKKVLEYLHKRGLQDETIAKFRLGFAPDSYDALYPYLLKKGISKEVLLKSGLVSAKNLASDSIYDKYRTRLIFPIFDYFGRVCGFGGRALKKDQSPKYLNSAENIIYNKSKVLYGLSHAKRFVQEKSEIILVEGYFDVILPFQAGITNIAATSGTALSDDQAKLIKRLGANVVSCFDNDDAGFEATKRAYFILQKHEINMRTVEAMAGKDPADFVLENGAEFQKFVDGARDFTSFFIDRLIADHGIGTINGRGKVVSSLLPLYNGMSPAVKDFFLKELATKIGIKAEFLYEEINNLKLPVDHPARLVEDQNSVSGPLKMSAEEIAMSLLLEYPFLFPEAAKIFDREALGEEFKSVYNALTDQYNSARDENEAWDFSKGFLFEISDKISFLRLYAEEFYGQFSEVALASELGKLVDRLGKDCRIRGLKGLQQKIVQAENLGDQKELKTLLEEQERLLKTNYGQNN